MILHRFVLVLGMLASASQFASAATLESYNLYGWTVGAYSNDKTGSFDHCGASVPYRSGVIMLFAVGRTFNWSMGFYNHRWQMKPGSLYDIAYSLDSGPQIPARAVAILPTAVQVPLVNSRQLFEAFQQGHRLTVRAAGETFYFTLTNSSKVLAATLQCTQRHVQAAANNTNPNPFLSRANSAPATKPQGPTAETRAEAVTLISNVLSSAGIVGFRIATPQEVPDAARLFDAVWIAQGSVGAVKIFAKNVASANQLSAALLADAAQACKGKFASGTLPIDAQTKAVRLTTGCETDSGALQASYSIFERPQGGFYTIALFGAAEQRGTMDEVSARLTEAALHGMGKK